ncbi:hypothetical protein AAVH_30102 [Aphelenchoides avenae]|nr:hypothetical protein AAVH_30102 [Aphelenchus avenae]
MALIFLEISAISAYTCTLMVTILRRLRLMKDKMSKKTYRMHQSLFTSLVYQWTVPTAMLTFSHLALGVVVMMGTQHSQVVCFCAYQFSTLHSTANSFLVW